MDQTMISGVDTSRVAVETRTPHEAQRVVSSYGPDTTETTDRSATPLVNPIVSVDASGLVVVQYRNDGGEVRLQLPSESVVRAYRQRHTDAPETPTPETPTPETPLSGSAKEGERSAPTAGSTATPPPSTATTVAAPAPVRSEGVTVDV